MASTIDMPAMPKSQLIVARIVILGQKEPQRQGSVRSCFISLQQILTWNASYLQIHAHTVSQSMLAPVSHEQPPKRRSTRS